MKAESESEDVRQYLWTFGGEFRTKQGSASNEKEEEEGQASYKGGFLRRQRFAVMSVQTCTWVLRKPVSQLKLDKGTSLGQQTVAEVIQKSKQVG